MLSVTLDYATYLGGSSRDFGGGIAVDGAGNTYIAGTTNDAGFPATAGAFDTSFNGGAFFGDAFVAKFDASGGLVWATYLGGSGAEANVGLALDSTGNVYVTGTTDSANFPTTAGAFDTSFNGATDMWAAKLDPSGSTVLYSTYLGGSNDDFGSAGGRRNIAVDATGNAYIAAHTRSSNFPTTAGAFQTTFGGGLDDALVIKLNGSGGLIYSTYLGGSGEDRAGGISLDAAGNAYVSGLTGSGNFPKVNALQATYGGGSHDGFVTKLNSGGTGLVYSTYLGGNGFDFSTGIDLDAGGQAFVLVGTTSTNLVTSAGAFQTTNAGGFDNYVTALNAGGSARLFATYLGGSGTESSTGLAVDASGNVVVAGATTSSNYPTANAFQSTYGGGARDGNIAKLNSSGTGLIYSSYLGGTGLDHIGAVALDAGGDAHVIGDTLSVNFPVTAGAFDTTANGLEDVFWARVVDNHPPVANAGPDQSTSQGVAVAFDATGSFDADGAINTYYWDFGDGSSYVETAASAPDGDFDGLTTHLYSDNGLFTVSLTVTDDEGASDSDAADVTVVNSAPIVDAGSGQSTTLGESLTIVATFDDPGRALSEGYTATINWGDGNVTAGVVDVDAGTVTGSHSYATAGSFTAVVTVTDDGDPAPSQPADPKSGSDSLSVIVIQPVQIDVKPGSDPNSINLANNGVIAVAVFTTADFDASQIDVSTVNFAGASAAHSALEDVDLDGDLDMILHFRTQDTVLDDIYAQLVADDINEDGALDSNKQEYEVSLTGETLDDQLFAGTDQLDLFLAGKSLRNLLHELAAAGLI